MVRVWVGMVGVIVPVVMIMVVVMVVIMLMAMTMFMIVTLMHVRGGIEILVRDLACADTLHVMVMAFLGQADLDLEAKDLFAVFAIQAVHVVGAFQGFVDPVGESING